MTFNQLCKDIAIKIVNFFAECLGMIKKQESSKNFRFFTKDEEENLRKKFGEKEENSVTQDKAGEKKGKAGPGFKRD